MSNTQETFRALVEPHLPELVQDTIDIAKNKKLKVNLRLKAMDMLFSRTVSSMKSIDHNIGQQINVIFMSPQEVAAAKLKGEATPLNDLAKEKRIERSDLPPSLLANHEVQSETKSPESFEI